MRSISIILKEDSLLALKGKGKIDYNSANEYYYDILKYNNWEDLKEKYQPIYNKLSSEFRIVAPKI